MYNPISRFKRILAELQLNGRGALAALRRIEDRLAALESNTMGLREKVAAMQGQRPDEPGPALSVWENGAVSLGSPEAQARILALAALLAPQRAVGIHKVRVGGAHDGGYVMLGDWAGIVGAVSIGIGGDDAWDRAMLDRRIPVAQFDHTISEPPSRAEGLHWQQIGLGDSDQDKVRTLGSLIAQSGLPETGDLILKLDAEGHEWRALAEGEAIAPLGRFRQILIELHGFDMADNMDWYNRAADALAHLHRTHAVVHVHANNNVGMVFAGGIPFPRVLEITYARRDDYDFEPDAGPFPGPLDAPCTPAAPDLPLGSFRFPAPPPFACPPAAAPPFA